MTEHRFFCKICNDFRTENEATLFECIRRHLILEHIIKKEGDVYDLLLEIIGLMDWIPK